MQEKYILQRHRTTPIVDRVALMKLLKAES